MKDEKLEQLARQILERAEELGVDSISVSWWFGGKQQERGYFFAPDSGDGAVATVFEFGELEGVQKC